MCALEWEEDGAGWQRRRHLWVWEEELLAECSGLLLDISLQTNISDSWIWRTNIGGGYSVRDAYSRLTALAVGTTTGASDLIWHQQVPLKVSVLAWRLLRNRLPTKDNLVARNIIPPNANLCVGGCGEPETANHLFLSCPTFAPLWILVCSWLHIDACASEVLQVHFTQFVACLGGSRTRRSFLQLVWLCCMSVIWHERNNRVFKAEGTTMQHMLERVKLCTYWWMKAHNVHLGIHTHRWWSSPLVCLGID
ncbi:hypothetical protein TSUD_130400 [Trifolium subterraneum]|nr:hypothetical protein TSUD_130400 [Trifolium subterraneum]